jgi:hypothetical protein
MKDLEASRYQVWNLEIVMKREPRHQDKKFYIFRSIRSFLVVLSPIKTSASAASITQAKMLVTLVELLRSHVSSRFTHKIRWYQKIVISPQLLVQFRWFFHGSKVPWVPLSYHYRAYRFARIFLYFVSRSDHMIIFRLSWPILHVSIHILLWFLHRHIFTSIRFPLSIQD